VTSVRIAHPIGGRPSPDLFGKTFHVASPLQDSVGVITPSSLHYIATTRGAFLPEIDPKQHTLTVHGTVDRALTFTMDDLKRLPSVTRMHFVECAGNRHNGRQKNVQESHGMTSNAEWTGVLLSTLLKEAGLKDTVLDEQSLPKVKMPIGDHYGRLPDWKPGTKRLESYPY
jgi:sulfane dehydrogenase subunit SoxC